MFEVMRTRFGSHLYGTSTPASDLDFKAVHIPDAEDILMQRVRNEITVGPNKKAGQKNSAGDVDAQSHSLQHYLQLLAEGQTGAIDMLFAPDNMLLRSSHIWDQVRMHKDRLICKRSAAFVGYCRQQANKYGIKGSRVAEVKAVAEYLARECSLLGTHRKVYEISAGLELLCGEHTSFEEETTRGRKETYFVCCNRMVGLNNTIGEAYRIFNRIFEEYGERARKAQSNEGIDWKALSHAVRVGGEAIELLTTGNVTFPLPNATHVLDIKLGKLSYNQVAEEIEQLLVGVEEASAKSKLPAEADQDFIDHLVYDEYMNAVLESAGV